VLRHVVGSGAIESRSYGCVTLHAVGAGARSRTIMPHARGVAPARRDPPETRRRCATKEEDGRAPRIAAGECCPWQFLCLCCDCCLRPELGASRYYPRLCVAPERDQQLARHSHNGDPPCAPGQRADALAEPLRQLAARLVAKPEPCELDHSRPCARVSRPADAPIAIHTAALVGHWCDADVARDLPAVVE